MLNDIAKAALLEMSVDGHLSAKCEMSEHTCATAGHGADLLGITMDAHLIAHSVADGTLLVMVFLHFEPE